MSLAIITGAHGQDGHYLCKLLTRHGIEPVAVGRDSAGFDLADAVSVADFVALAKPAYIFHLAANSTVKHEAALENHATIATGALHILEAVRQHAPECRVFLAGSAYQFRNTGQPLAENHPWETRSVYAAARCYTALLARAYRGMGLKVFLGYLFHHESPRRKPRHLSQRIATAARTLSSIEIGGLDVVREWTWAGDMVEAIWSLVNHDRIWEANLGSGLGHGIGEFAEACFAAVGQDWQQFVRAEPGFVPEFQRCVCNPDRIFSTGWRPRLSMPEVARLMIADCGLRIADSEFGTPATNQQLATRLRHSASPRRVGNPQSS